LSDTELLVVSNRDGVQNLWRIPAQGNGGRKVTNFTSGTLRALTVSRRAQIAAYQRDSVIWTTDLRSGQSRAVSISAPNDARRNTRPEISLQQGVEEYVPSPNGRRMALAIRGDIFVMPEGGGTTRRLTTNPGMDRNPVWLDDATILYVAAGPDGKRSLKTVTMDGTVSDRLNDAKDLMGMEKSPDGKWIAFHRGDREIMVMPTAGGTPTLVATGDFSGAYMGGQSYSWSPDSEWLLIGRQLTRSAEASLVSRDGSRTISVARASKGLSTPVFVGPRTIAFAAVDGLDYDEARNSRTALYTVDLVPPAVTFTEDDLDKIDEPAARPDPNAAPTPVRVETRGLGDRRRKILPEGLGGAWPAADGRSLYANVSGQFSQILLPSGTVRPIPGVTGAVSSVLAVKNKVYVVQAGRLFSLNPTGLTPHAFNARYTLDIAAEEMALFTEAWWAMDRMFYDQTMHGKSWAGIKEEFAQLVPFVQSRDDFYSLMTEMVERLDSSHQGATSPEPFRSDAPETTAWLGTEWDWTRLAEGQYVVGQVMEGTPAAHPESTLLPGDVILSINGVAPGPLNPVSALLRDQAGRKVRLKVQRKGENVDITIRPSTLAARSASNYDNWLAWQRAEVLRLSNGQLGYIHIRGMDAPSLDVFLREIATELEGKKGVIVDVRFNGGGFTSHIILNIMRKTPWLIRTNRDLPGVRFSENQFRGNALEMPSALLTNEYSFSNAEIFSEGFRRMKIGPVIGEATAGGVIGTGSYRLWDGGAIRMPGSGAFDMDGENLEGNGRKPDIDVQYDPVLWMQGRDNQLERAVAELLRIVR
jgi:tricorn protease